MAGSDGCLGALQGSEYFVPLFFCMVDLGMLSLTPLFLIVVLGMLSCTPLIFDEYLVTLWVC